MKALRHPQPVLNAVTIAWAVAVNAMNRSVATLTTKRMSATTHLIITVAICHGAVNVQWPQMRELRMLALPRDAASHSLKIQNSQMTTYVRLNAVMHASSVSVRHTRPRTPHRRPQKPRKRSRWCLTPLRPQPRPQCARMRTVTMKHLRPLMVSRWFVVNVTMKCILPRLWRHRTRAHASSAFKQMQNTPSQM